MQLRVLRYADDASVSHRTNIFTKNSCLCNLLKTVGGRTLALTLQVCHCSLSLWLPRQDDYMEAVSRLHLTVTRAYKVNTNINFEVFIHKVDGLSDEHKIQKQRDIHKRANDDLTDAGLQSINLRSGSPPPPPP